MENVLHDIKEKAFSKQDAVNLLFDGDELGDNTELEYMDEYGNYVFPTDFVASTPNTASGSSSAFNTVSLFQENDK